MNSNYIAPEAFDFKFEAKCVCCKTKFLDYESRITFFQGNCPHCGENPCALPNKERKPPQDTWMSGFNSSTHYYMTNPTYVSSQGS